MKYPDHWDPEEKDKIWYRSSFDGQLGWFVKRDGRPLIKLDRPGPREMLKPFTKRDWIECADPRELSDVHLGEITFEADKVLCRILGKYELAYRNWSTLPQPEKKTWISMGPRDNAKRIMLYRIIKKMMGKINEENSRKSNPE